MILSNDSSVEECFFFSLTNNSLANILVNIPSHTHFYNYFYWVDS